MVPSAPLTLVVPVYHEQDNVERLFDEIARKIKTPHETLVVYDSEDDPTVPVVRALAPRYAGVKLLRNDLGRGVLNAIKKGFRAVPEEGVCVVVMADLSDDLAQVDRMYELVAGGRYDLVCGSRYMRGGRMLGGPFLKGFLSRLAGVSLHALAGMPTRDATNAYRMYSGRVLRAFPIESLGGFELSLEITVKAFRAGFRIAEVPTTWRDRTAGTSQFRFYQWLPKYLYWYSLAFRSRASRRPRASRST
jgi:hypothetical protein